MTNMYTIGKLAALAGVNIQTIRYYERRKLLAPSTRKDSGYRLYNENVLKRLRFIRRAKELGFTLEEIRALLDLRIEPAQSKDACEKVKYRTEEKLKTVEQRIEALESVKKVLKELLTSCTNRRSTEECPILKALGEDEKD